MVERVSVSREFVRGAARFSNLVYLISKGRSLLEQEIAHTSLIGVYNGLWVDAVDTIWDSTAVAVARYRWKHLCGLLA